MPASDSSSFQFASALTTEADTSRAVDQLLEETTGDVSAPVDLAVLFMSQHHAEHLGSGLRRICDRLGTERLFGCTGEAIVGVGRELEGEPAMSLWLARLPGVPLHLLRLELQQTADGQSFVGWPPDLPASWPQGSSLLLLGEPYSFPADALLERLAEDQPGVPVIGGMASGASRPGENRLILADRTFDAGAVAVLLEGLPLRTVVSQGCRPIGRPLVITKAERNAIQELGGKPALVRLQELFEQLPNREKAMVQRGLHVGRVVSEYQDRFEQGDFLVRNVVGVVPDEGAIHIGDYVRAGQTVQFHIRDQQTADQELQQLLSRRVSPPPQAALMFTCNGRGTRMFDTPHHDAGVIQSTLGNIPLAGFFAQGELGPIGGKNFLHGFTASIALFDAGRPGQSA